MVTPFFVSDFSEELLSLVISKCFESEYADIKDKPQFQYLSNYLDALHAKTIVSERFYVDKDYSDDYSNYYVSGFKSMSKHCMRLHFFDKEFDHVNFEETLINGKSDILKWNETSKKKEKNGILEFDDLSKHYLGFIVIKPLPFTFIGKTCLKAPNDIENGKILKRKYKVNLFGAELEIPSIAFQEQDRVISACATTAVWSLLHALNGKHKVKLPSPSDITLAAIEADYNHINGFPNKGLNTKQIISALEKYRLKHHEWNFANCDVSFENKIKYISSYLNSEIPILAGLGLYKREYDFTSNSTNSFDESPKIILDDKEYSYQGEHAVCIVGSELKEGSFYLIVHDDRVGPFRKYKLTEKTIDGKGYLLLQAVCDNEVLALNMLMVATYHKKRIHLPPIHNTCQELKQLMVSALDCNIVEMGGLPTDGDKNFEEELTNAIKVLNEQKDYLEKVSFDIELLDCKTLKTGYLSLASDYIKKSILFMPLPHFVWRVRFFDNENQLLDLLFDGTDMPNGNSFICEVILSDFGATIIEILKDITLEYDRKLVEQSNEGVTSYAANVIRSLQNESHTVFDLLDRKFGTLRAPKYIKSQEVKNNTLVKQSNLIEAFTADDVKDICLQEYLSKFDKGLWVFNQSGVLVIGGENTSVSEGHPTLTGSEPARIGGEIIFANGQFLINSKSGRFSGQYKGKERLVFLQNALGKFKEIFSEKRNMQFEIDSVHMENLIAEINGKENSDLL